MQRVQMTRASTRYTDRAWQREVFAAMRKLAAENPEWTKEQVYKAAKQSADERTAPRRTT